jgi:uracil-DNA glycosylase family 4
MKRTTGEVARQRQTAGRKDARQGATAAAHDPACQACPRLAEFLADVRQRYPQYHGRPVPSFGEIRPALLIVGLAPGLHGANATGRPFTGDYAGILLYQTLHDFGFSNQAQVKDAADGLRLFRVRIANAVKCVPPQNKPLPLEIATCNHFLRDELLGLAKDGVILALGTVAHGAVLKAQGLKIADYRFCHGATHRLPDGRWLVDSFHCSRYNTQTRRLTPTMFRDVFKQVSSLLPPQE